jgi:hypothetical protein
MDRIDGTAPPTRKTTEHDKIPAAPVRRRIDSHRSLWRPPGLAWAASFVLAIGLGGIITTVYRSSQPLYTTYTDAPHTARNVLHIAFDRSVTVGEAEAALRSNGARVVEGPDSSGIIGITPGVLASVKTTPERVSEEMRELATHLRADPRVRWVEPVPVDNTSGDAQVPASRGP